MRLQAATLFGFRVLSVFLGTMLLWVLSFHNDDTQFCLANLLGKLY